MPEDHEITAELSVEELAAPAADAPPARLNLTFAAKTDLGRMRENNEDKFDWWEPDDPSTLATRGRLYAVADGMGGHAAGQIAAEMALKALGASYFAATRGAPEDALSRAIVQANAIVHETARAIPSRSGMGCTVVAVAVVGSAAIVGWAGDSRVYLLRDGAPSRLTEDHSWVAEQVRQGVLTEEEAERSSYRNIITRCLGTEASVTPDVARQDLLPGDTLLLCSDGLTGVVDDAEIAALAFGRAPSFACRDLIERANERGGPDNVTVAVVRIDAAGAPLGEPAEDAPDAPKKRWGLRRR